MQIKSVTVGLSLTESLPDYCNVRPSLTITADVFPGDNIDNAIEALDEMVRIYVEGRVDDALEAAEQSPKYYTGPLYRLHHWQQRHALVILPASAKVKELPGQWRARSPEMRLSTLRKVAAQESADNNQQVIDCPNIADLLDWWHSQTFYVAYGLVVWYDRHDYDVAQTLFIRHDLQRPQGLRRIDDTLRTLDDYTTRIFPALAEWTAVDDQLTLDQMVADWLAAHPKPDLVPLDF